MNQISAEIILDSMNAVSGDRLTTFKITLPKFILAEFNTHRSLSRSFSSSRAVPAKKVRQQVLDNPYIPVEFGKNQPGMQSAKAHTGLSLWFAKKLWLWARYPACFMHWLMQLASVHKQVTNRLLEPWMIAEGVVTATEFHNFFLLRCHPTAQPDFRELAQCMRLAYSNSIPQFLQPGEWHTPFVYSADGLDLATDDPRKVSAARCARVSYYLRTGERSPVEADLKLCDRLRRDSHMSPFEHCAMAMESSIRVGNFMGWQQYRKFFSLESGGDYERDDEIVIIPKGCTL
jgi:hypothetical protein